ncbi:MAG: hypothetical protein Q9162_003366 [Coniocarpon cinnabarinum]
MPAEAQDHASTSEVPSATYGELENLSSNFDSIDALTTAFQHAISKNVFGKRAELAQRIPNFWPLVFEQAPPEVDQYIQPSDSNVLASYLTGFSVERFESQGTPEAFSSLLQASTPEISEERFGEPRSIRFRFEFKENEFFEDRVIEKDFWFRRSVEGESDLAPIWAGRVSAPTRIHWKQGKDITNGLTDAACDLWEAQTTKGLLDAKDYADAKTKAEQSKQLPEYSSLMGKVDRTTEGSQSFFTWFGYHGPWVSVAQDRSARAIEKQQREKIRTNGLDGAQSDGKAEEDDEDEEDIELSSEMPTYLAVEIFPDGEELAVALAEDVWVNAIDLFKDAQESYEMDDPSGGSFDEADLEQMDEEELAKENMEEIKRLSGRGRDDKGAPPTKKRKT